ncbi:MAG TPA: hypothetical protein VFL31_02225, partial [Nitrospiraceae bacterium]|nr:hypothetical protein [Nitrospiraceae bacterium]
DEILGAYLQVHLAQIARDLARHWDGAFVKAMGDGGLVVFDGDWRSAFEFCRGLQRYFQFEPVLPTIGAAVRVSIVHGSVVSFERLEPGDVFGISLSKARRICNHARDNEVLVDSALVEALLSDSDRNEWISEEEISFSANGFGKPLRTQPLKRGPAKRRAVIERGRQTLPEDEISDEGLLEAIYRDRRLLPNRAWVSTFGRRVETARASIWQLARKGRPEAMLMLADAAQFRGNFRLARSLVQELLDRHPQEAVVDLRPFAYHLFGVVRGAQDFHELALCYYQWAFRAFGSDQGKSLLKDLRRAIVRRDISIALGKLGFASDALREIKTSIREIASFREAEPRDRSLQAEAAISVFRLGHLYGALGDRCANSAQHDAANKEQLQANEEFRRALGLLPRSGAYIHREANFLVHLAGSELRLARTASFLNYLDKAEKLANAHRLTNRLAEIRFLRFEYALKTGDRNSAQQHLRVSLRYAKSYDPAKALETVDFLARVYGTSPDSQRQLVARVTDSVASGYEAHKSGPWHTIAGHLRKVIAGQWSHRIRYVEALEGLLP